MLRVGDVVVVKAVGIPNRFRTIKPGSLFKVTGVRNGSGTKIVVGDQANPRGINTRAEFFYLLTARDRDSIKSTGNTDLAVRVKAIEDFGPASAPDPDMVRVNVNGAFASLAPDKASALSKKNSNRLFQRKLARALSGRR
jgi:hypothetical protein